MPLKAAANLTMLWASALVDELVRSGLRHVVVCPGNRSGPLAFAFAEAAQREAGSLKVWSHVEERAAGFFALGLAKMTGDPAAIVCTTGTAAANLHPAVIEAWHGRVPLLVLTADRPADLRDVGANQAIFQAGIYGPHVRWHALLGEPRAEERSFRHLRLQACRALAATRGPVAGPVHLDVPFAKPLEPSPRSDAPDHFAEQHALAVLGRADKAPFVRVQPAARRGLSPDALAVLVRACEARRGIIVLGPQQDPALPALAAELSIATGFPLFADPLSGARFGAAASVAWSAYDAVLASPRAREALVPEVVLRLGGTPTSDPLLGWLEQHRVPQVVLDEEPWREPALTPGDRIVADPATALRELLAKVQGGAREPSWAVRWRALDRAAADAHASGLRQGFFEGAAVASVVDALPSGTTLMVSNSLPVRDLDRYARPREATLRVVGNRGASGIDGITSTALGLRAGGDAPTVLITGDLAFLHDLPGLLLMKTLRVPLVAVVLHNDGGRIFEQLPAARFDPPFEQLFTTPHGLDFEHAARLFGARFRAASDAKGLREELDGALVAGEPCVLEVRFDPREAGQHRAAVDKAAQAAVEAALGHAR